MAAAQWLCLIALCLAVSQGFPTTHSPHNSRDLGESAAAEAFDSDLVQLMSRSDLVKDDIAAHKATKAAKADASSTQEKLKASEKRTAADSKANKFAKTAADQAWKAEGVMAAKVAALEKVNAADTSKLAAAKNAADLAWKAEATVAAQLNKETKLLSNVQKVNHQKLTADDSKLKKARATIKADETSALTRNIAERSASEQKQGLKTKQKIDANIMSKERSALKQDKSLLSKVQTKVSSAIKGQSGKNKESGSPGSFYGKEESQKEFAPESLLPTKSAHHKSAHHKSAHHKSAHHKSDHHKSDHHKSARHGKSHRGGGRARRRSRG